MPKHHSTISAYIVTGDGRDLDVEIDVDDFAPRNSDHIDGGPTVIHVVNIMAPCGCRLAQLVNGALVFIDWDAIVEHSAFGLLG